MKQLRWVIALGIAAILLIAAFIAVDHYTKQKEEAANIGAAKTLFSFDGSTTTRITIDNEDGHFAFDWDADNGIWQLVSAEQFNSNTYAISAVCNMFCSLRSEKTVAFDCQDTSIYGFDNPVTIKVYTTGTGEDNPYVLYVGNNTPTYDAYYAMVGGSNDVYTIDYTSGSYFCLSKDTMKNAYLFDTFSSGVSYYKLERGGKVIMEMQANDDATWTLLQPADMELLKSNIDDLTATLVHVTVSSFVEENPADLSKYGLDHPHTKLTLRGSYGSSQMATEIWFGDDLEDDIYEYGYFVESKQVFSILKGDVSFTQNDLISYLYPYCVNVLIEDLDAVEIDMGDVYDMHETLHVDYANGQFALGDLDIDALEDDNISTLFQNYYRSISNLRISDTDFDADPQGDPAMTITYYRSDGTTQKLDFIKKAENDFWLMIDGQYTHITVRLNRFTSSGTITKAYEELIYALRDYR